MARKRTVKQTKQVMVTGDQQTAGVTVIQQKAAPSSAGLDSAVGSISASTTLDLAKLAPTSKVKVTFILIDVGAGKVSLSGQFNGWSMDAAPMKLQKGTWETSLELAPGRYEYKFIVDGQWIPDPLASQNVYNEHGTLNSVIEVRA